MKKIILPTDFSDNAYNAIQYARQLFKREKCTFYLLNTYTPAVYQAEYVLHSPGQIGLGDIYQSHSEEHLAALQQRLEKEEINPKHTFIKHSAFNTLIDEVLDLATRENADLIIMGTQGATGAKEILFGSHTVHVIKRAQCPVIAIPSAYQYQPPKKILFPTDYEINYDQKQLAALFHISEYHQSNINVMHVRTGLELTASQQKNKKRLAGLLSNIKHSFHELSDQEIIDAINNFQMENDLQFLVMIRNKHTFMERLFIEPVIKKIGFHVTIPFMVIPHKTD